MSVRLLIDMNLSPEWVNVFADSGHDAIHWSSVGDPRAPDTMIMAYARADNLIVFTHDLDFGTLLALTHADGPSVVQFRGQNTLPAHAANFVLGVIAQHETALADGALIVIDERHARVRVLPI